MKKFTSERKSKRSDINAGSMADIAFLMLIFFLVATVIASKKAIPAKLPPWDPEAPSVEVSSENVISILINSQDQLLIEGEVADIRDLRGRVKEFISNPDAKEGLASSPQKAVIALTNDRGTSYGVYLQVYNELKGAYNELWDAYAKKHFDMPYHEDMPLEIKRQIRSAIPLVISESEPTNFGEE